MNRKKIFALLLTTTLASSMCMTSFGYQSWDSSVTGKNWRWEDWDDDGVYECYYYKDNGNRGFNLGTTPDGYAVNEAGQWIVNGEIQTRTDVGEVQTQGTGNSGNTAHSGSYDPAHPLAGKIDDWNLRITDDKYSGYIYNNNVQAMLTGQMDQYFAAPVGEYVDSRGNHIYTTQEDYDVARKKEQDLYNWYCNWLNSMNFESMSEMERAKEIQKVLGLAAYEEGNVDYSNHFRGDYAILINKQGHCSEFTMTAISLAKAMGLKSGMGGNGNHSWYYIQVDGNIYSGENYYLNLSKPTSDYAYVD